MLILWILLLIVFLYYYVKRQVLLNKLKNIPGPPPWPIFGNYLELKNRSEGLYYAMKHRRLYGPTYKIFAGPEPVIITTDTKLMEIILGTNVSEKSIHYTFFKRWWGDGLLTSSGNKWRSHRKILTPAFHYNILEDFVEVFERRGKLLINNLEKQLNTNSFNIFEIFTLYTLDIICETAMGTCINAQENPNHTYMQSVKEVLDVTSSRITNPLTWPDVIYKLTKDFKRELTAVSVLTDFSSNVINSRRTFLNSQKIIEGNENKEKRTKATFMDILLNSTIDDMPLTNQDIREEVDTFLFEGHDTTAIALSFITYNLSLHQEVQQKVWTEVHHILGNDIDKCATLDDLKEMKYLEMVIKETLRLYPSVPIHARKLTENVVYGETILPKGIHLVINQYVLHRNKEVFEDPETFDPERFNLENQLKRHPYAYIPFSAGLRNCIGQRFAMLELKSAISKLISKFEIYPAIPQFVPAIESIITLASTNGIHVRLKRRIK